MPLLVFFSAKKMPPRIIRPTRREFLRASGSLAAALFAARAGAHKSGDIAQPLLNLDGLERFADPLPIPSVLTPSGTRPSPDPAAGRIPYYRLAMRQVESKVHRDLKPTRLWGYGKTSPGPTIETRRGEAFLVEWANELPRRHFLTIDHAVHGAEKDKPDVRAVTHLHGAKAPPQRWLPGTLVCPGKIGRVSLSE